MKARTLERRILVTSQTLVLSATLCVALTQNAAVAQSAAAQQSPSALQCTTSKGNGAKNTPDEPVALVAGKPIYQRDLDSAVASQILPLRNQEYQIKSKGLEDLIRQRLVEAEANKQGITIDQLYIEEVDSKIPTPSEGEVAAYYLALKSQIKTPLQEIKAQLQTNLKALETRQARQDYADSLRTKADVAVLLQQPRVEVAFDRSQVRGELHAPVTIVEFADYQCPYCRQAETTLDAVLKKYPGQVNLAFRDFPLTSIHAYAEKASEASRCAGRQGKFWQFHDALFANQAKLDESGLNSVAQTLALDITSFQSCLASGEYKTQISRDQDDGRKAGISSTPSFFVNGIFLSGAQPESAFENVIEDQLRTAKTQSVVRASR
jgi:protein-disulfide isomerase